MAEAPWISTTEWDAERLLAAVTHQAEASLSNKPVGLLPDAVGAALSFASTGAMGGTEPPPYVVDDDGMATLTIAGPLLQRSIEMCGLTLVEGYNGIAARARAAFAADDVACVLGDFDSPGGDCAGCPELADMLQAMSVESGKPFHAHASEMIASAAYWLASSAAHLSLPRTGQVGSIGTIVMGMNKHGALASAGVRVLLAASPQGKLLAGAASLLDPEDHARMAALQARMQGRADEITVIFAEDVGRRRGLKPAAVLALDAAMFGGEAAVRAGLADAVMSRAAAESHLKSRVKRKVHGMSKDSPSGGTTAEGAVPRSADDERLIALGRAVETMTGHTGEGAGELVAAWRDSAARVPALERRVKVEALSGRLAAAYPPAERFANGANGLPDPAAGPHERFDSMSLAVFDARTSGGTVHPATLAAPTPALTADAQNTAKAKAAGIDPVIYNQAAANLGFR